jgi:Xaa-Pro aminopeptidase
VERARAIKSAEEIACIRESIAAVEDGVARLEAALQPGITENALWALLHQTVIERGGDYVETRLLSSGPRTNPWYQECSSRPIEAGELVALDTDVVGCHGYYCDFSRSFLCGAAKPRPEQGELYRLAHEQVCFNLDLLRPGQSFREFSERAWTIPEAYVTHRYYLLAHGVGMTGEYPYITHAIDFDAAGYDGVIEPGMTLCLESFIGAESGGEGVKLEQQVLVTESGVELLTRYPFDEALLGRAL